MKKTLLTFSIVFLALVLQNPASADREKPSGHRAALLLGNWEYDSFQLPGASESLDEVEKSLESSGYQVTRRENLNEDDQKAAIEEFARSVPTGGVAVVYYCGLGAHAERFGKWYNLLRPVNEKIESDNDYRSRGFDVAEMLESLGEHGGARTHLVFLDACWDSPILPEKGKVNGGMREFEIAEDATVMFAAASGQTLPLPEGDKPSPLATALAKHIDKFDDSVAGACDLIAADIASPWCAGAEPEGIGPPSDFPVAEELREGKTPGEGYVNAVGMTFRWCPPGKFTMGSEVCNTAATRDRKPVEVELSRGFWIGEHEVTQREYNMVMRKTVRPDFTVHNNAPFWGVSEVKNVEDFCKKLTELEKKAGTLPNGWEYACPTEAQWEYACRAGSKAAYCFGDDVAKLGLYGNFADAALLMENPNCHWADGRSDDGVAESLAKVGSYRANAWGIRDMHGNVAELVADHLLPELPGGTDPLARVEKDGQTQIRGGAWCSVPLYCESSFRNGTSGRDKLNFVGFRVVLQKVK